MQLLKPVLLLKQHVLFVDDPLNVLGLVLKSARLEQAQLI